MWAEDFQFDNQLASSYGLMICSFDSSNGTETIRNGADIELTTTKTPGTNEWRYINSRYSEVLTAAFQIAKKECDINTDKYFSIAEQRLINRWLNRRDGFHDFRIIKEGYENIYFEAQANVNKIELSGKVIGFEVTITTNRPYGMFLEQIHNFSVEENGSYSFVDISDEIGHNYPYITIKVLKDGNLNIKNSICEDVTTIQNCTKGEEITIDNNNRILSSSARGISVMDDFNFKWLKIENNLNTKFNTFTFSLPCEVTLTYKPVCKISF